MKLVEDKGPSLMSTEFVLGFSYFAPLGNAGSGVESQGKIRTFWPPVKIMGGVVDEMSE